MNKLGMMMSLAAVAAVSGCIDPDYRRPGAIAPVPVVVEPKAAESEVAPAAVPVEEKTEVVEAPAPAPVEEVKPAPAEPEFTLYIVQNGDYLSKISKKFNIKVTAIKELNGMKDDRIRVGQKIKLPGKVEVGEQKEPEVKKAASKATTTSTTVYKGELKEYVVKSGDTLGAIAYSNGINIRQLKALNKLSSDSLRVGQKLQIPATKVQKAEVKPAAKPEVNTPVEKPKAVEAPAPAVAPETAAVEPEPAPAPVETVAAPAAPETVAPAPVVEAAETYVVQEGDDVMSIAVRFNTSSGAIRELNNLGEDDQLAVGRLLKLPPDASEVE